MDSVILLLLTFDGQGDTIRELGTETDEILGPSDIGDLIDSIFGCLLSDTLSDPGIQSIHLVRVVVVSSLSKSGPPLLVLQFRMPLYITL